MPIRGRRHSKGREDTWVFSLNDEASFSGVNPTKGGETPRSQQIWDLRMIYEAYLSYFAKSRPISPRQAGQLKRLLSVLNRYLERSRRNLGDMGIEDIDSFVTELNVLFAPSTRRIYIGHLRSFLTYASLQGALLTPSLPAMIPLPRRAEETASRQGLHRHDVIKLFALVDVSSVKGLRAYALLQLALSFGLLPKEMCMVTLDDIHFRRREIALRYRSKERTLRLPLSEKALKAIAAYVISARPSVKHRTLFLDLRPPFHPMTPIQVSRELRRFSIKTDFKSSPYRLRHTYVQNLVERGVSVLDIKHLLGHEGVEAANNYGNANTTIMRQVLFDEIL
jgi:integrase/recombinase XerD